MAASVEDLCNQALRRIGNKTPIGYIYEGTRPARIALEIYGQTRDELLKQQDWDFAERFAPAVPQILFPLPPGWAYIYQWPSDCLKLRYVYPPTFPTPDYDPRPTLFGEVNGNEASSARLIVANISPAELCYTGQVTDMTTWDAAFTEALVDALAARFAAALNGAPEQMAAIAAAQDRAVGDLAGSQTTVPPETMRPAPAETRR